LFLSGVLAHNDRLTPNTAGQLKALTDSIRAGVLLEDYSRRIEFVNPAFCALMRTPLRPEQLVGADHLQVAEMLKELFTRPDSFLAAVQGDAGHSESVSDILPMRDGRVLERTRTPVLLYGVVDGYAWTYHDVTERILRTLELRESEARVRAVLESAPDGVIVMDGVGRIREYNAEATKLFGWVPEEVLGLPLCEIMIPETLHSAYHAGVAHLREEGHAHLMSERIRTPVLHKNGSTVLVDAVVSRVEDESGGDLFTVFVRPAPVHSSAGRRWAQRPTSLR
jgi:PAS domain S-box-containing protein